MSIEDEYEAIYETLSERHQAMVDEIADRNGVSRGQAIKTAVGMFLSRMTAERPKQGSS